MTPRDDNTIRTDFTIAHLTNGGAITQPIIRELAEGLLSIAEKAMPDTYFATDSRCKLARAVLDHLDRHLDESAQDTLDRCRIARDRHNGHASGAWSFGEQLAVSLVLNDRRRLAEMGYTEAEAKRRTADGMINPPADMDAWVAAIRAELNSGNS